MKVVKTTLIVVATLIAIPIVIALIAVIVGIFAGLGSEAEAKAKAAEAASVRLSPGERAEFTGDGARTILVSVRRPSGEGWRIRLSGCSAAGERRRVRVRAELCDGEFVVTARNRSNGPRRVRVEARG